LRKSSPTQKKAAIHGLRFGAASATSLVRRGRLRLGTDEHNDGDLQPAGWLGVYPKEFSLHSSQGERYQWFAAGTKLRARPPQTDKQNPAAFAEFKFADVDHFAGVQGFPIAIERIPV
jgi:hypothetical protein